MRTRGFLLTRIRRDYLYLRSQRVKKEDAIRVIAQDSRFTVREVRAMLRQWA